MPYAVRVDERDDVWLTDFGSNALDPKMSRFTTLRLPTPSANVRQLHGRRGEVRGAESRRRQAPRRAAHRLGGFAAP